MSECAPLRGATRLDAKILKAFRQACRENEPEVAEHLMRALETMAASPGINSVPPAACARLHEAYLVVADESRPETQKVYHASHKRRRTRKQ